MRIKRGIVVSDKMDKTVVVAVDRYVKHPLYKKLYKVTSRFYVDDPNNLFSVGDELSIIECAPISKMKRWRVYEDGKSN